MKKNVTSGSIVTSNDGVLLKFDICHFTFAKNIYFTSTDQ